MTISKARIIKNGNEIFLYYYQETDGAQTHVAYPLVLRNGNIDVVDQFGIGNVKVGAANTDPLFNAPNILVPARDDLTLDNFALSPNELEQLKSKNNSAPIKKMLATSEVRNEIQRIRNLPAAPDFARAGAGNNFIDVTLKAKLEFYIGAFDHYLKFSQGGSNIYYKITINSDNSLAYKVVDRGALDVRALIGPTIVNGNNSVEINGLTAASVKKIASLNDVGVFDVSRERHSLALINSIMSATGNATLTAFTDDLVERLKAKVQLFSVRQDAAAGINNRYYAVVKQSPYKVAYELTNVDATDKKVSLKCVAGNTIDLAITRGDAKLELDWTDLDGSLSPDQIVHQGLLVVDAPVPADDPLADIINRSDVIPDTVKNGLKITAQIYKHGNNRYIAFQRDENKVFYQLTIPMPMPAGEPAYNLVAAAAIPAGTAAVGQEIRVNIDWNDHEFAVPPNNPSAIIEHAQNTAVSDAVWDAYNEAKPNYYLAANGLVLRRLEADVANRRAEIVGIWENKSKWEFTDRPHNKDYVKVTLMNQLSEEQKRFVSRFNQFIKLGILDPGTAPLTLDENFSGHDINNEGKLIKPRFNPDERTTQKRLKDLAENISAQYVFVSTEYGAGVAVSVDNGANYNWVGTFKLRDKGAGFNYEVDINYGDAGVPPGLPGDYNRHPENTVIYGPIKGNIGSLGQPKIPRDEQSNALFNSYKKYSEPAVEIGQQDHVQEDRDDFIDQLKNVKNHAVQPINDNPGYQPSRYVITTKKTQTTVVYDQTNNLISISPLEAQKLTQTNNQAHNDKVHERLEEVMTDVVKTKFPYVPNNRNNKPLIIFAKTEELGEQFKANYITSLGLTADQPKPEVKIVTDRHEFHRLTNTPDPDPEPSNSPRMGA